jgi:hypothetical protein
MLSDIAVCLLCDFREQGLDVCFQDRRDFLKPMRRGCFVDDLTSPESADRRGELLTEFFKSETVEVELAVKKIFVECSGGVWFSNH